MPVWRRVESTILLNEAFPEWFLGHGIFQYLEDPPWSGTPGLSRVFLDMDYFGNHSGQKKCSPLVYRFIYDANTRALTDADRGVLANLIKMKFYPIWEKLYATYNLSATRDPFANVDIRENIERALDGSDVTDGENVKDITGNSLSEIGHGEVITGSGSETRTTDNSRHGFNSDEAVPTESSVSTITRNAPAETHSGTDSNNNEFSQGELNTETKTFSTEREESINRSRKGIDGGKSSQELISMERDLWLQQDFFAHVYRDIDSILASQVYPRVHKSYYLENT